MHEIPPSGNKNGIRCIFQQPAKLHGEVTGHCLMPYELVPGKCIKFHLRTTKTEYVAFFNIEAVCYARFFRFKNGPFPQKAKKHHLMPLKTEQFHHSFF